MGRPTARRRGLSLVELVIVVVIIGMIASMAIPRLSRGATGASEAALVGNLNVIRNALLRYAVEHKNTFPGPDAKTVVSQLTQYSDRSGGTSTTKVGAFVYGPYLLAIPPGTIGPKSDSNGICIDDLNSPPQYNAGSDAGWVYNPNTGEFYPNAPTSDLADVIGFQVGGEEMAAKGG
jgi:prepilin-type N-terminal cleavage/methylation domain-containing protein